MISAKRFGLLGVVFLGLFLFVSYAGAQSEDVEQSKGGWLWENVDWPYDKVTLKIGALGLRRGDNHDNRITGWADAGPEPPAGSHARVYSDDLDLGWAPGMDASIMLHNDCYGLEARYMGLTEWSESEKDSDADLQWGDEANVDEKFKSKLNSVELNALWWPCGHCGNDRFNLLAGFRWLRLTDRLIYSGSQISPGPSDYWQGNASGRNTLWGLQVGIQGLLFGKRDQGFSLDGSVKTGWYANKIHEENGGVSISEFDGIDFDSWSDKRKTTRGVNMSEAGINLNYAFTKNIAASIGYELLYISRISTPVANNYNGGTQSVLYQGGRLGMNFMF